jgi:hypothetical protein
VWLPDGPDKLAEDAELRAIQVQWLWDTLQMRRIAFALWVASVPMNVALALTAPRVALVTVASSGAGLASLVVGVRRKGQNPEVRPSGAVGEQ